MNRHYLWNMKIKAPLLKWYWQFRSRFTAPSCGYGCDWVYPYGFVPEAGCPEHDMNEDYAWPLHKCVICGGKAVSYMMYIDKHGQAVDDYVCYIDGIGLAMDTIKRLDYQKEVAAIREYYQQLWYVAHDAKEVKQILKQRDEELDKVAEKYQIELLHELDDLITTGYVDGIQGVECE